MKRGAWIASLATTPKATTCRGWTRSRWRGAGISGSTPHDHEQLPVLVMGKGNGSLKTGQHLESRKHAPVTNLHLALLHRLNVRPARLGDSTDVLEF